MRESQCLDTDLNLMRDFTGRWMRISLRRSSLLPIFSAAYEGGVELEVVEFRRREALADDMLRYIAEIYSAKFKQNSILIAYNIEQRNFNIQDLYISHPILQR